MESTLRKSLLDQLDAIVDAFGALQGRSAYKDVCDLPDNEVQQIITLARAAIRRVTGTQSAYMQQAEEILKRETYDGLKALNIVGVVGAVRNDLDAGYLISAEELIHGEIFGDFLEMAHHLLEEGYKDAAAVIVGGALEAHLRQLCNKHGIPTDRTAGGSTRSKSADKMNSELASASAYSKLNQKSVTAWLDLRNKAAHGHYDQYSKEQVALFLAGVRDLISSNPA